MVSLRRCAFVIGLASTILGCGSGTGGGSKAGSTGGQTASTSAGDGTGGKSTTTGGGNSGGKSASGAGGSSGTAKASGGAGPAISSAPAAWQRPAECGGIGDTCPNGIFDCGASSSCQLEGYVCIPSIQGTTSMPGKSAERPYCAAYTCMTFEEASCFCTGKAAASVRGCASPTQLAGLCVGQGSGCTATTTCCPGLSCVNAIGTNKQCEQKCTSNADCQTGCCTDLRDTGDMICSPASACAKLCKKTGEVCDPGSSSTPNNCCQGDCVISQDPYHAGCRQACTKNSDCVKTGCCTMYANSTRGFCVDSLFCTCGAEGAACGQLNTPECCDGTYCAGSTAENSYKCLKACKTDDDCSSHCCVPITGTDRHVCEEEGHCR
jgi:hypothetical protein